MRENLVEFLGQLHAYELKPHKDGAVHLWDTFLADGAPHQVQEVDINDYALIQLRIQQARTYLELQNQTPRTLDRLKNWRGPHATEHRTRDEKRSLFDPIKGRLQALLTGEERLEVQRREVISSIELMF
jgi:hypothetical protein